MKSPNCTNKSTY